LEDFRLKQLVRKDLAAGVKVAEKHAGPDHSEDEPPAAKNGKPRKAKPPQKTASNEKLDKHTEMPEWLRRRIQPPAPNGSKLAAESN